MKVWILTFQIMSSKVVYGYKFIQKTNCEKVGKDLSQKYKKTTYKCELKKVKIPKRS